MAKIWKCDVCGAPYGLYPAFRLGGKFKGIGKFGVLIKCDSSHHNPDLCPKCLCELMAEAAKQAGEKAEVAEQMAESLPN